MSNPPVYEVLIHESERHQHKARIELPVFPFPGLRILHRTGTWEILRAQLTARDPGSLADKYDDPHIVMVIAKLCEDPFFA